MVYILVIKNMKKILIILSIAFLQNIYGQSLMNENEHNGLQISLFMGGGFGNTNASTNDFGDIIFRGSRMNVKFQIGYAYKNWSSGFSFSMSSLGINSIEVQNTAYGVTENWTLDDTPICYYLKRYFMPLNIFVSADLGISKFGFFDENSKLVGSTKRGFSWNLSVGKEFALGKKKRFGIGAFAGISGLKCNDLPPFDSDTYSYISPGVGLVMSWN
jgi:hypothetical protein